MDDPTRAEALKKLGTFEPRVGYPSKWRDYSALQVENGKHFENIVKAAQVRMEPSGRASRASRSTATSGA